VNVSLYVEGRSDKIGLETLFEQLILSKAEKGIRIQFFDTACGDRKNWLLREGPIKAVQILSNDPMHHVGIIPDLYPPNRIYKHETGAELLDGLRAGVRNACARKGRDPRIIDRFHPFFFKHDFEVLLLASPDALAAHLGAEIEVTWKEPPEDQNHNVCPKQVIERLFQKHGKRYGLTDVPAILKRVDYTALRDVCPQSFAPLANFLESF
jgi:hypothetical protein